MITTILLVFAFVLIIIEALRPATWTWPVPHLGWLGMALFVLSFVVGAGWK